MLASPWKETICYEDDAKRVSMNVCELRKGGAHFRGVRSLSSLSFFLWEGKKQQQFFNEKRIFIYLLLDDGVYIENQTLTTVQ